MPLVNTAPNRLLSGQSVSLLQALVVGSWAATGVMASGALLASALITAAVQPGRSVWRPVALFALGSGLLAIGAVCGQYATAVIGTSTGLERTSLGSGFWLTALWVWLAVSDIMRQGRQSTVQMAGYWAVLMTSVMALLLVGTVADLSTLQEYANRDGDFWRALGQHIHIIALTACMTVSFGLPLGVAIHRHPRWAGWIFPVLNLVQTIPSIALFALLMAVLAALGKLLPFLPAWGIRGVGLAPAVLALTLYSLLPLVRSTYQGLAQVPHAVIESAQAMGLSRQQQFWRIEIPLALPVLLSGLKVFLIQSIGLTAVAALIGAGGLGSLMFEGLFSSALDLVVLAVVPMVVLAWLVEGLFLILGHWSLKWTRRHA